MKKKIKQLLMLMASTAFIGIASVTLVACGDDEPEQAAASGIDDRDLMGFWIDEDEEIVFNLERSGILTAYELRNPGSMYYTTTCQGEWYYNRTENVLTFDWNAKSYPNSDVSSSSFEQFTVIDCSRNELLLRNSAGRTFRLESHGGNLSPASGTVDPPTPDNPSQPAITSSDFIGAWYHSSGAFVFDLKSSGLGDMYTLKSWKGDSYTKKSTCSWEFDTTTSKLTILSWDGKIEVTVKEMELPYGFTTSDGNWDVCSTLPSPEDDPGNTGVCDDNRILGKWKGSDFDETYTLTFDEYGTMIEKWSDGSDSETNTFDYVFYKGKLNFPDSEPSFANLIGNAPFEVSFSSGTSPKTMTISKGSSSMIFTRQ